MSPQGYGLLFALGIVGIMATNHLNAHLVAHFGIDRLMRLGAAGTALSGLIPALMTRFDWGGLIGLVTALFMFVSATGFIVTNSIVGALGSYPERAGTVSALVGTIQYGTGIIGSALVGWLAGWLVGWLAGWLVGWLAGLLVGWFADARRGRWAGSSLRSLPAACSAPYLSPPPVPKRLDRCAAGKNQALAAAPRFSCFMNCPK